MITRGAFSPIEQHIGIYDFAQPVGGRPLPEDRFRIRILIRFKLLFCAFLCGVCLLEFREQRGESARLIKRGILSQYQLKILFHVRIPLQPLSLGRIFGSTGISWASSEYCPGNDSRQEPLVREEERWEYPMLPIA